MSKNDVPATGQSETTLTGHLQNTVVLISHDLHAGSPFASRNSIYPAMLPTSAVGQTFVMIHYISFPFRNIAWRNCIGLTQIASWLTWVGTKQLTVLKTHYRLKSK